MPDLFPSDPGASAAVVVSRHNIRLHGRGTRPLVLAHGFGCDQNMWRDIVPAFEDSHRIILFDHLGAGGSDLSAYDRRRHATLDGYATDVLSILEALDLRAVDFVGHSAGAMIGALAAIRSPARFGRLVMVCPSPCYLNDGDYRGGFEREALEGLLEMLDSNFLGWARSMAPVVMGNPDRPELAEELSNRFCRNDPDIARRFARATFFADHRADMPAVPRPTLLLETKEDAIVPPSVGHWMVERMPHATLVELAATGHCPHVSHPVEVIAAMRQWFATRDG
jgi:sigma-B regulation protein RsbQ